MELNMNDKQKEAMSFIGECLSDPSFVKCYSLFLRYEKALHEHKMGHTLREIPANNLGSSVIRALANTIKSCGKGHVSRTVKKQLVYGNYEETTSLMINGKIEVSTKSRWIDGSKYERVIVFQNDYPKWAFKSTTTEGIHREIMELNDYKMKDFTMLYTGYDPDNVDMITIGAFPVYARDVADPYPVAGEWHRRKEAVITRGTIERKMEETRTKIDVVIHNGNYDFNDYLEYERQLDYSFKRSKLPNMDDYDELFY
jgi:hypothetical protein